MTDEEILAEVRAIRALLERQDPLKKSKPSESALAAAYQVASRVLGVESHLIWNRTGLFIAINSLVVAGLAGVEKTGAASTNAATISPMIYLGVPLVGAVYAILWGLSLERAWEYHRMFIETMRLQEKELSLETAGVFTRGLPSADGSSETRLGGLRARHFSRITTVLFVLVYVGFAILGVLRLCSW